MPSVTVASKVALHSRPAARIAARAQELACPVTLEANGRQAPARSLIGILSLEAEAGTQVTVSAQGRGAREAVSEIARMIERGPQSAPGRVVLESEG
jgi:phosphotransferase system HPr (HPr) family protein